MTQSLFHRCAGCGCGFDPKRRLLTGALLASGAIAALPAFAADPAIPAANSDTVAKNLAKVNAILDREYPDLEALYKDIHSHPELGFQEVRTAALLAKEMRALGFTVTEGVGKTGIVAIFHNGPGPMVLVRTELDALPMEEKTGLPYASRVKAQWEGHETFVGHTCGHDIHMASWVGTAKALVTLKDQWHGTLMFIGQPSEETVQGAKRMLDDKLFERFGKPDLGFALHVDASPYGQVEYKVGVRTSSSDSLYIVFKGRGGHGSRPSVTIDPVVMASRFVVDVQSVVSREKDAAEFGVVTIGSIQGGSAENIIPDSVTLRGTIRSYSPEVRKKLLAGVARTAKAVAEMADAPPPDIQLIPGASAVVNDKAITDRTAEVFKAAFGDNAKLLTAPNSASEDYSEYITAGVPSLFFTIGGLDPAKVAAAEAEGKTLPANHSPLFAPVPEPTIKTGVRAMSLAVLNAMA
jgi:hippurate hydrolase